MYLVQGLNRAATVNPSGLATVFRDRRRNWAESAARIFRLAGGLPTLGINRGDRVAILALNSDYYFEALFAAPAAGAVIVPINTRLAPPEIAFILEDSGAKALLVDDTFVPMIERIPGLSLATQLIYIGDGPVPAGMRSFEALLDSNPVTDGAAGGDDLAGIFYTGGTTGRSKGVMLSHRNLVSNAAMVVPAVGYGPDSVYLHAAPMFHLADGMSTFGLTMLGGTHAFVPRFDPVEVLAEIARNRVTHTVLVPTMINTLVNHPDITTYDVSSLLVIPHGGSPIQEAVEAKAKAVLPGVRLLHVYGMTEAAPLVTAMDEPPEPNSERVRSCGRPALLVDVRIADPNDNEVPRGMVGEVQVRGPNIMLGYWNQPEASRIALRGGWYHTGDGGRMDEEGYVYIVDRLKDMIITGGENVYSAEVENAIATHDDVAEVAVIGIPDERWGEAVHAVVVPRAGRTLTPEQIVAHCRGLIAGYKCPRSVEIRTTSLPLSGAGKVMKTQLREPFWAGRDRRVS